MTWSFEQKATKDAKKAERQRWACCRFGSAGRCRWGTRPTRRSPCCGACRRSGRSGFVGRWGRRWPSGSAGQRARPCASSIPSPACGPARGAPASRAARSRRWGRTWRGRRRRGTYVGSRRTDAGCWDRGPGRGGAPRESADFGLRIADCGME